MSAGALRSDPTMPIAIVGIGCRFPGGIVDPESFWNVLIAGVDAITEIPADRFDIDKFYDPKPGTRGKIVTRWGGFVDQRLEEFDAAFFGISRSYAERLDPQQRLLLETAWESLEDAGLDIVALQGSPTGVFVGQWVSDFEHRLFAHTGSLDFQMAMGTGRYAAAGRVSYAFGFRGPSLAIDAACSSGLAAVHLAVRSLRNGDSAVALAGGVNVILQPHIHLAYSHSKMLAPDGRCRFGDARGAGYVRSEGAAVVVLKPLAAALAAGDRVYAVIRGSAVNNDGNSSGVMGRPSRVGQEELLRSALGDGDVRAAQLDYVEAHGTGTRAGDPVELAALGAVLAEGREPGARRTLVGSVKTNFGHTEAAAGVAGLIKTALMLERSTIVPSLHFTTPNPEVAWAELPLEIASRASAWPEQGRSRFAGVSSYGIGGTNAHAILESAPVVAQDALPIPPGTPLLLPLSTRSAAALRAMATLYADLLMEPEADAHAICWSAATRRSALPYRAAFVAADRESMVQALRAYASGDAATASGTVHDSTPRRIAFVAPGQGAQWRGMVREFARDVPVFRRALQACDAAARRTVPWSIVEELMRDEASPDWIGDRIDVIQPTLVAVAIAYAAWLRSVGVIPDAVVGHSLGEVAAAAIAGALDIDSAMMVVCARSALMRRTSGHGAMAVVDLSESETQARLAGREPAVGVAVSNSPRSTVISGDPDVVHTVLAELERDGVFARLVKVDVASHGPQMAPLVPELIAALSELHAVAGNVPIYSSVTGAAADGPEFDAEYWGRNLRQPVQFARTVERMIADGVTAFVELGPHPVLTYAIAQTADATGSPVVAVSCGRREQSDVLAAFGVVATLWTQGATTDWRRVMPWGQQVVRLPRYPWQRERFWFDAKAATPPRTMRATTAHRFLGPRIDTAADAGGMEWDITFSTSDAPWLLDHVVRGSAIVPAAAMVDVMAAAVREAIGAGRDVVLRDVVFLEAVALRDEGIALRLVATRPTPATVAMQLRVNDGAGWSVVARATGSVIDSAPTLRPAAPTTPSTAIAAQDAHYRAMHRRQLAYGPAFQVVTSIDSDTRGATARLAVAPNSSAIHGVTLLDGALQALLSLAPADFALRTETLVPVAIHQITLRAAASAVTTMNTQVLLTSTNAAGQLTGDLTSYAPDGMVVLEAQGVRMQVVRGTPRQELNALRHHIVWTPVERQPLSLPVHGRWLFVRDRDGVAAAAAIRLRAAGADVVEWERQQVLDQAPIPDGVQHIVICTALDATGTQSDALEDALIAAYDLPLNLLQRIVLAAEQSTTARPPSVVLVTSGAVRLDDDSAVAAPLQAATIGLARVARHEHPQIGCVTLDVAPDALADALLAGAVSGADAELAWRAGECWANRIETANAPVDGGVQTQVRYTADVETPGLVDSVSWRAAAERPLLPHQVEIAVAASGLNFLDLLGVLNSYPGTESSSSSAAPELGLECSGIVTRVGRDLHDVTVGDRVLAVCEGSLSSHAIAHGALVVRVPDGVPLELASGFPLAFLTAARALEDVARLRAGERVLIHSAAGGVGLAAVQIAQQLGAEVFATAGTADKRALLRGMGIQHVFDSRNLEWGDAVLAATDGAGVDVVLNSLAGAAIETGFQVLATYGRFIEIGKRDVFGGTRIGMDVFRKQVVLTAVYLLEQMRDDAESLGVCLRRIVERLAAGELQLLPTALYSADDVSGAFRALLPGTHVGKMVVSHAVAPTSMRSAATVSTVRATATYLITGGLGALGLRAAAWLIARGARYLVLVGRMPPDEATERALTALRSDGADVVTVAADVSHPAAITALQELLDTKPALAGIIHAAGVLDDGLVAAQTPARMRYVAAAKVGGALQLSTLTGFASVDFVVLYSSVASALGTPGQANYAAANAMLDALAQTWRVQGIRATSIGFGPFAGSGLATEGRRLGILADSGIGAIRTVHADMALETLAGSGIAHQVIAAIDAELWLGTHDSGPEQRRLSSLNGASGSTMPKSVAVAAPISLRDRLAGVIGERQRSDLVLEFVQREVAAVLRSTPERVEPLKALRNMGIDSLTALELRNRLEQATALRLPGTLVFTFPNASAIAAHLLERLTTAAPAHSARPVDDTPDSRDAGADARPNTDAELDALAREMASMDDDVLRRLLAEHTGGDGT